VVRGNTAGPLVKLLREGGATEVHMRVSSPPVRHPCFMGVDMATHEELIAHEKSVAEICEHIGADSLAYLSHEGMIQATRSEHQTDPLPNTGRCSACFTGNYPIKLEEWWNYKAHEKQIFDSIWG
jgi:amidophosphoribosyltransferase